VRVSTVISINSFTVVKRDRGPVGVVFLGRTFSNCRRRAVFWRVEALPVGPPPEPVGVVLAFLTSRLISQASAGLRSHIASVTSPHTALQ